MSPRQLMHQLVCLLVDADSLICVLENLTRGYQRHVPEDKDCWCNGCVHARADEWQLLFREVHSEFEATRRDKELKSLRAEVAELRRWKAEAVIVLDDWETVWIAAGKPGALGTSKPLETAKVLLNRNSKQP